MNKKIESGGKDLQDTIKIIDGMNNDINQLKDIKQATIEKRISNDVLSKKTEEIIKILLNRINEIGNYLQNPQIAPVLMKMASVINRLIAIIPGEKTELQTQIIKIRETLIDEGKIRDKSYPMYDKKTVETHNLFIDAQIIEVLEENLLKIKGEKANRFFEDPSFRKVAIRASENYNSLSPEFSEIVRNIVKQYGEQNNIKLNPNFKIQSYKSSTGQLGFQITEPDKDGNYIQKTNSGLFIINGTPIK